MLGNIEERCIPVRILFSIFSFMSSSPFFVLSATLLCEYSSERIYKSEHQGETENRTSFLFYVNYTYFSSFFLCVIGFGIATG